MPLIDLPPQVSAECDGCGTELEYDGITMYFRKGDTAAVETYDWWVAGDGKIYCEECAGPWCDACTQPLGRGSCEECRDPDASKESDA